MKAFTNCMQRRRWRTSLLAVLPLLGLMSGCVTSMAPGRMDAVQPTSSTPRAGQVYLIRGWGGMFSWGIDELAQDLTHAGINSHVFQHDQRDELARTMVERYRGVRNAEPLCMVAHSAGSDDALYIAGELKKAGVLVDLLITLDNVDATTVPLNVRLAHHYWAPGNFGDSNFLRGLPLKAEPGSKGTLVNVNLAEDGRQMVQPGVSHVTMDKDHLLRPRLVELVLKTCPTREMWLARNSAGLLLPPTMSTTGRERR